jgi:hypothetical protein
MCVTVAASQSGLDTKVVLFAAHSRLELREWLRGGLEGNDLPNISGRSQLGGPLTRVCTDIEHDFDAQTTQYL